MQTSIPLRDNSELTVPEHVLTRTARGETVLLNLDNERYYGLEGVGTRFWELVEAGTTFGEAVTVLLREYEVERDALVADLTALVTNLRENGLVTVDES
jgi:Coenzyme PQQ synthesis protein D (PqqD)